jgi:hypothetical protein
MSNKSISVLVLVGIAAVVAGIVIFLAFGTIDAQTWIHVQPYWGEARIQNGSGLYWKGFAKVSVYPRYLEFAYNDEAGQGEKDKESIRVTFNDGSTAQVNSRVVVQTPDTEEKQLAFHRMMNGSQEAIKSKVKAYLTECLKSTAPLMSSTEHQTSLKTTFSRHVEDQFTVGLYDMRQVQKELTDRTDAEGNPVTVEATEIVLDENNKKVIAKQSPIVDEYGMVLTQFSIEGTDYDPETLLQFKAKKEQFLAAATSKAEREAMVQEALKIEAEGLKDKAKAEAEANVLKATAVIAAEQKAEVALQTKIEAETVAEQAREVARIGKEEAELKFDIAVIDANAVIVTAKAEQEKIILAGALTEHAQAIIDAGVLMNGQLAEAIKDVKSPQIVFSSGAAAEGGDGEGTFGQMIQLLLLKQSGLMDKMDLDIEGVDKVQDAAKAAVTQ